MGMATVSQLSESGRACGSNRPIVRRENHGARRGTRKVARAATVSGRPRGGTRKRASGRNRGRSVAARRPGRAGRRAWTNSSNTISSTERRISKYAVEPWRRKGLNVRGEQWKRFDKRYSVSNLGRVKDGNRISKQWIDRSELWAVTIHGQPRRTAMLVGAVWLELKPGERVFYRRGIDPRASNLIVAKPRGARHWNARLNATNRAFPIKPDCPSRQVLRVAYLHPSGAGGRYVGMGDED